MIVTENPPAKGAPPPAAAPQELPPPPPPPYAPERHDPRAALRGSGGGGGGGEPAGRRFLTAFALAVGVWLVLSLATRSVVGAGRRAGWGGDEIAGPEPGDGRAVACVEGADWAHDAARRVPGGWRASATFALPLADGDLFVLARGARAAGALDVVAGAADQADALVQVNATYLDARVMDKTRVCTLERGAQRGVGVFTAREGWPTWPNRGLSWHVTLTLPAGTNLSALATTTRNFRHTVAGAHLAFGTLVLDTTNAPVELHSVDAAALSVHTTNARVTSAGSGVRASSASVDSTNGAISGSWHAANAIALRTTNAAITAHIVLASTAGAGAPARAVLRTTNGALDAELALRGGDAFTIVAHTTNEPLRVVVGDAPAGAALALDARTTNGRAAAALPPAFEGAFRARTSNKPVTLRVLDPADPRGDDRKRVLEGVVWNKRRTQVDGRVRWGSAEGATGSVVLETTNAPAELTL